MGYSVFLNRFIGSSYGTFGHLSFDFSGRPNGLPAHVFTLEPSPPKLEEGPHRLLIAYSQKFKRQMVFVESIGHVGIMFHVGNTCHDTSGCILLGSDVVWSSNSKLSPSLSACPSALMSSKVAVEKFNKVLIPMLKRGLSITLFVRTCF